MKRAWRIARRRLAHPTASAGGDGAFVGESRHESRSVLHNIVAIRIHRLCGDHRMECGADPGHILAMNLDPRSRLEDLANGCSLDGLRLGRAPLIAERVLDWLWLVEPSGCDRIRGGLGGLGSGEGVTA